MTDNKFIRIGETLHASIPYVGKAMNELLAFGNKAFESHSVPLELLIRVITDQAENGADFIAINVDDFRQESQELAIKLMCEYVKLVHKYGAGVPACIDSSDDEILLAGLKQWYECGENSAKPMVNSIKTYTADKMLALKAEYDFCFIAMLMAEESELKSDPVAKMYAMAEEIFDKAVGQHGFEPGDIFFDTTVYPIAIDMPMEPGACGFTYRTMETARRIRSEEKFKGVHFAVGFSNCARDLPGRRLGVIRAYIDIARKNGIDGGIVNIMHCKDERPPSEELIELVESYANIDGNSEHLNIAMMHMAQFCIAMRETS